MSVFFFKFNYKAIAIWKKAAALGMVRDPTVYTVGKRFLNLRYKITCNKSA